VTLYAETSAVLAWLLGEAAAADVRRRALARASRHWHIVQLHEEILDRARGPFPGEPVGTLEALHLASALVARTAVSDLTLLGLDDDIRRVEAELRFVIAPVDVAG
jgi:hypothetical protein